MNAPKRSLLRLNPSLSLILLLVFLATLWLAGGASRADALGQVVVRGVAWILLVITVLFGERPSFRGATPVLLLLAGAFLLTLSQLIPLPPEVWQTLPGRDFFVEASAASGQGQPWRPWSLVPGATLNAASSLIVPAVAFVLLMSLKENERSWLPGILLSFVATSTLLGLLQFSGAPFNNPFINDSAGQVSGVFANRNHFALLTAYGCLLAPVWAFVDGRQSHWRGSVMLGLLLLFVLTVLASGSRAGLLVTVLGLGLSLLMVRQAIKRALSGYPRWLFPASVAAAIALLGTFVLLSVAAGRAVSINRMMALDAAQDTRRAALPTLLEMIQRYFPFGSGLGGFDTIFRIHEPLDLLKLTYFNHAHNDYLEIALDAGLPGLLLLLTALLWWAVASLRAWRAGASVRLALPKLGSAMVLLTMIASIVDYPARTPTIMAMMVVAGVWLCGGRGDGRSSLPPGKQPL